MIVEHRFDLKAKCPVDDASDTYYVTVKVDRLVKVEELVAEAKRLAAEPVFQEDLTQGLADHFGAKVTTQGRHMDGTVETTCFAEPGAMKVV